ncbi:MAG TPA: nicotinate-nucleotide adenylyltransferase [Verrucomicrobiae bacterium]|nr:nicotinate-nucleotide adenylyltransferase [Verrucomicrobiae bacterium]
MARAKIYKKRKIGILGGTFNPIHLGHLLTAQDALEQLGLERVIFIPSATPPHKVVDKLASGRDRLRMIRLAIHGQHRFDVDDLEIERGGKSYSVDTLTELRRRHPRAALYFIIGADSLRELHLWREVRRLVTLCTFVTVPRPGFEPKPVVDPRLDPATRRRLRQQVLRGHACAIASRDIRARVASRRSIRYLVPDAVREYIRRRRLYS